MPQSLTCLNHHVVFSTQARRPILSSEISASLHPFIGGLLRKRRCKLLRAGGIEDHIHLLVSLHQTVSVADAVRVIKSVSSGWIHDKFERSRSFAWQSGYAAFSVSYSAIKEVCRYIDNQRQHHRKVSFQDELRAMLRVHDIEYDERYLWD